MNLYFKDITTMFEKNGAEKLVGTKFKMGFEYKSATGPKAESKEGFKIKAEELWSNEVEITADLPVLSDK